MEGVPPWSVVDSKSHAAEYAVAIHVKDRGQHLSGYSTTTTTNEPRTWKTSHVTEWNFNGNFEYVFTSFMLYFRNIGCIRKIV